MTPSGFSRSRRKDDLRRLSPSRSRSKCAARRAPSAERLQKLEAVLSRFFPLAPTYLPRSGTARAGMAMMADSRPTETFVDLGFLSGRMDRTHLVNAHGHRCEVFLTKDAEMLKEKVQEIEALLGVTRIAHPRAFLTELLGSGVSDR
jgi:hypothetical protein